MGQPKFVCDHGSKQELKRTYSLACLYSLWAIQKFKSGGWILDGIHWRQLSQMAESTKFALFNNVFLKVREVSSYTWDLHFRMFLWLKFVFSNQLFMYICSEEMTTKKALSFFRASKTFWMKWSWELEKWVESRERFFRIFCDVQKSSLFMCKNSIVFDFSHFL